MKVEISVTSKIYKEIPDMDKSKLNLYRRYFHKNMKDVKIKEIK